MSTIDTGAFVSEMTKNTLAQFGWQPGDPVLDTLSELIQAIREKTPPKKAGVLIDIDVMAPQDIEAMREALSAAKSAKELETKNAATQAEINKLAPGVRDAFAQLVNLTEKTSENTEKPQEENTSVEIVDDRRTTSTNTAAPSTPNEPAKPEIEIPPPAKPDTSPETGVAQPDLLSVATPAFCPRCDWDMRRAYEVEISPVDKENFLVTILSGTRFKRDYTILNGKYTVIFRTLLAEENKKIHRQLVLEQKANEFFSDTEWFLRFFEYRLACSVESIIINDKVVALIPELDELTGNPLPAKLDDPSLPGLLRLHSYVIKELLGAEVVRRLVSKQFREFQRLYEALEAMALEPNFW